MNSPGIAVATRGPILLITFGMLLAVERFSQFDFSETWPTLVIVFGVTKLLERIAPGGVSGGGTTP